MTRYSGSFTEEQETQDLLGDDRVLAIQGHTTATLVLERNDGYKFTIYAGKHEDGKLYDLEVPDDTPFPMGLATAIGLFSEVVDNANRADGLMALLEEIEAILAPYLARERKQVPETRGIGNVLAAIREFRATQL